MKNNNSISPKSLLEWIYLKEAGEYDDYIPGYGNVPKGMIAYGKKLGAYVENGMKNLMPGMELNSFLEVCAGVLFEQAQENGWFSR